MKIQKQSGIPLLVFAVISFISATILTLEKLAVLTDPNHIPSCSINPFLACGPIMNSWQAAVFGIPNSIIGMVGFGILTFIIFTGLIHTLPKWYYLATFIGVSLAMGFIIWLISQSLYDIGALCIYCMIVWIMMIPTFWYTTALFITKYNLNKIKFIATYKWSFIIVSYMIVVILVFVRFQTYWLTLF